MEEEKSPPWKDGRYKANGVNLMTYLVKGEDVRIKMLTSTPDDDNDAQ